MRLILLISLLISGCAPVGYRTFSAEIDAFIKEADKRGRIIYLADITIEFNEIKSTKKKIVLGHCDSQLLAKTIQIDESEWQELNKVQRELVIFHELGHCALDLPHTDNKPAVMNSFILDFNYYKKHRDTLLDDLFKEVSHL